MALHLHDNDGARGQHQLPFDGHIDWPAVMKKIAATGKGLFENRGNDEFLPRRGSFQGKNRKAIFRLARIFDAERGPFWVKRRRFRFFKQALRRPHVAGAYELGL